MPQTPLRTLRTGLWHLRHGGPAQFSKWRRRRNLHQGVADGRTTDQLTADNLLEAFPAAPNSDRRPVFDDLRVGTILDEFSAESFGYEWAIVPLKRDGWTSQLGSVDFVFIESAWNGNGGDWKFKLTGTAGPSPEVVELLAECRHRNIPTVFWNKEDPPHFEDFLPIAKLCDFVFTSDVRLIPEYRRQLCHEHVEVLPFAAQPAIHNPERPARGFAVRDIAFAGMYFAQKYPDRREQMDILLGAAAMISERLEYGLEIFSRFLGHDDRYQFPGDLGTRVIGSLPYRNLLTAYKNFKVFLNVNSVVDSPSMCARRIFEITASGTPVVSTPSAATKEFFPTDEVAQPATEEAAALTLRALVRSHELRDRSVHKAQRRIWSMHTYSHRAMTVMDSLGIDYEDPTAASVSVVVPTNRPEYLAAILETHGRQVNVQKQLVIVTHGFDAPSDLHKLATASGVDHLIVVGVPASESLGACLNRGIEATDGLMVAKMDDDDLYGPHYLADQLSALRYSGADLVGKQAHYLYLRNRDIVMCRFPEREHRFTDLVMGPTLLARRDLFKRTPFADRTVGEDTDLQERIIAEGGKIYSADRFNFVQVRGGHAHTWSVDDDLLLANSDVHTFGFAADHYFF